MAMRKLKKKWNFCIKKNEKGYTNSYKKYAETNNLEYEKKCKD